MRGTRERQEWKRVMSEREREKERGQEVRVMEGQSVK